jgi:hypothetical protein
MPAEEGLGFDDDQSISAGKEPRKQNQGQAGGIARAAWFRLTFQVESQLFAKENVFRFEGRIRTRPEEEE